ncbi:S8 family peptidase [Sediminibacillus albus]|uniref:Minor extracellular protease Epr n=1 Tax=Sediminibacillus albus TaxID=407036 RepID=A0A1G8VZH1_9BACI|nr:S8 family serine peptidase [Sediminibacillus albus]SDJ70620.1 minor extracellular protease Epr [Sediminibacillus albus]
MKTTVYKFSLFSFIIICTLFYNSSVPSHAANSDQLLVGYENNKSKEAIIEESSQVVHQFQNIPAMLVLIQPDKLEYLHENYEISYTENNLDLELTYDKSNKLEDHPINDTVIEQWNIEAIGAPSAWQESLTGENIKIAIIDTGISDHADLAISDGISTVDYTTSWKDDNGHGTHVAGIIGAKQNKIGIVGVAPTADLFAVKALDNNGEGNLADLVEAIDWAIQQDMDIINLSLGTSHDSQTLKEIIKKAYSSGILIVGASGNNGSESSSVSYPAKYPEVIAVSAINKDLLIESFASTGTEVELSAPGTEITSTHLNNLYAKFTGTSQASPHVTGMLALLKQKHPNLSNRRLREIIADNSLDLGELGRDSFYGHGMINYSQSDIKPPAEVSGVKVTNYTSNSITISWDNPDDKDLAKVNLIINENAQTSVSRVDKSTFTFFDLAPDSLYEIIIKSVDSSGNESEGFKISTRTKEEKVEDNIRNNQKEVNPKEVILKEEKPLEKKREESEESEQSNKKPIKNSQEKDTKKTPAKEIVKDNVRESKKKEENLKEVSIQDSSSPAKSPPSNGRKVSEEMNTPVKQKQALQAAPKENDASTIREIKDKSKKDNDITTNFKEIVAFLTIFLELFERFIGKLLSFS